MIPLRKVSRKVLETMRVGDSLIVSEPPKTKNAGRACQGYACRLGIKITTKVCLIVIPHPEEVAKAVIVTRIA